jgi:hypothetical protein
LTFLTEGLLDPSLYLFIDGPIAGLSRFFELLQDIFPKPKFDLHNRFSIGHLALSPPVRAITD